MIFFSKTTNGFYRKDVHGNNIPKDAVEITEEVYQSLLTGQNQGKIISSDDYGNPILVTTSGSLDEIKLLMCKNKAKQLLEETDWVEIPSVSTKSDIDPYLSNVDEFLSYRAKLRKLAVNVLIFIGRVVDNLVDKLGYFELDDSDE